MFWETGLILPVPFIAELRLDLDFVHSFNNGIIAVRKRAVSFWMGVNL